MLFLLGFLSPPDPGIRGRRDRQRPERRSTKTKSIQVTYAGEDFKQATITFSQFQPKP